MRNLGLIVGQKPVFLLLGQLISGHETVCCCLQFRQPVIHLIQQIPGRTVRPQTVGLTARNNRESRQYQCKSTHQHDGCNTGRNRALLIPHNRQRSFLDCVPAEMAAQRKPPAFALFHIEQRKGIPGSLLFP